jgi:hypothetical protein
VIGRSQPPVVDSGLDDLAPRAKILVSPIGTERNREGGQVMSESVSRILYPFEIARRPSLEPEVRQAILSRWSAKSGSEVEGARAAYQATRQ